MRSKPGPAWPVSIFQATPPVHDSSVFSGDNNPTAYYLPGPPAGAGDVWRSSGGAREPANLAQPQRHNHPSGATPGPADGDNHHTINGLPVTASGTNAFYGCTADQRHDSFQRQQPRARAFWNAPSWPMSTIGTTSPDRNWAFSYCTSWTSVSIPGRVTSIGDWHSDGAAT